VRPSWDLSLVELKPFTDGLTNKLVGAWLENKEDMVLVRVYGEDTEKFIDRKNELLNMKRMSVAGGGSQLYATFTNGMAYQFIHGEILETKTVLKPETYRKVARAMAIMHRVELGPTERTGNIWSFLHKLMDYYPSTFKDPQKQDLFISTFFTRDEMKQELANLRQIEEKSKSPIVLCHKDPMPANMVLREDGVTLIDLEYAGPNPAAYDLAQIFNEYVAPGMDYEKDYPSLEIIKDWIREYLKHFNDEAPTQEAVEELYKEVLLYNPCCHFFWMTWCVLQAVTSDIEFDFLGYGKTRLDQYKLCKENM